MSFKDGEFLRSTALSDSKVSMDRSHLLKRRSGHVSPLACQEFVKLRWW